MVIFADSLEWRKFRACNDIRLGLRSAQKQKCSLLVQRFKQAAVGLAGGPPSNSNVEGQAFSQQAMHI